MGSGQANKQHSALETGFSLFEISSSSCKMLLLNSLLVLQAILFIYEFKIKVRCKQVLPHRHLLSFRETLAVIKMVTLKPARL